MAERRHIIYFGRVQGVGFRAAVQRLAQGRDVSGFVRNLPNGSVELVVEGETAAVDGFLARVAERMVSFIESIETQSQVAQGLRGFSIRR